MGDNPVRIKGVGEGKDIEGEVKSTLYKYTWRVA
jgi:hypothetical protein